MGRPEYKIKTNTDFYGAYSWIKKKFKNDSLLNYPTIGSFDENIKAKEAFDNMIRVWLLWSKLNQLLIEAFSIISTVFNQLSGKILQLPKNILARWIKSILIIKLHDEAPSESIIFSWTASHISVIEE